MVGALSQVVPDLVAGDLCRTSFHNLIGGYDAQRKREWVHYEWSAGGNGAFRESDGPSAMATIDWGDLVTVQSTEVIETRMPLVVETSRLATDSGGAGTTRGGLSMQRSMRVLAADSRYSLLSDGAVVPAFGVMGGLSGVQVGSWVETDGVLEGFDTPGKIAGYPVGNGSVVVVRSAGGGGYGDPLLRDPKHVWEDVEEGYVSRQAAHDLYGVSFDAKGAVDPVASEALRRRLRGARFALAAVLVEDSYESGAVSKRRICRLHPKDAAAADLRADDLVEVDARHAAPLRAWLRIDPSVKPGSLPIDQLGLTILKASPGERLEMRRIATIVSPQMRFAEAAE
jgi:N-methylhydantoinase B